MEDLLTKLELRCLNDAAEKLFATQCNSKEGVCLIVGQAIFTPPLILGGKNASR